MAKRKSHEQKQETLADNVGEFPPADVLPSSPDTLSEDKMNGNSPDADEQSGESDQWTSKLPEPFGRHRIELGDGRTIRLLRSNRWQQSQIQITAPKDMDPRPSKEDTQFLKEHGFRWRGEVQAWTRQFLSPQDKEEFATIEAEQGETAAAMEKSRRRGNSDADAHQVFVTLANRIRARNGKEPVSFEARQELQR